MIPLQILDDRPQMADVRHRGRGRRTAYRRLAVAGAVERPAGLKRILGLSAVVCALTQALYIVTARWYGPENSIHIEVLLPAFVIGMLMKHREIDTRPNAAPQRASRSCSCCLSA